MLLAACGGSSMTPSSPTTSTGTTTTTAGTTTTTTPSAGTAADGTIYLQNLPVDLSALDYAAMVANRDGREDDWLPLDDFGRVLAPNSASPDPKTNPQPTFFAPLGTPVMAVVSGTVSNVASLYSNDFSIMIASSGNGGTWEHEHVMNVRVAVGEKVSAGQHIADVSDYECAWGRNGNPSDPLCQSHLGLVELGLLYGGASPMHRCPFDPAVVSPSAQAAIFAQLDSARARIKAALNDPSAFGESSWATPECVTLERVAG